MLHGDADPEEVTVHRHRGTRQAIPFYPEKKVPHSWQTSGHGRKVRRGRWELSPHLQALLMWLYPWSRVVPERGREAVRSWVT